MYAALFIRGPWMKRETEKKTMGRKLLGAVNRFDRASTTLIGSWWWLLLWTAYIGAAILEPYMADVKDYWPGAPLFLVLIVMVITFLYEAMERWLGTLMMNCLISLPVVPVLFVVNVVRMIMGTEEWSTIQKVGFLGVQALALVLTWLHVLYTRKRWRAEPPRHLRPRVPSQPYKPSLVGSLQWATLYLMFLLFCAGIFILVLIKKAWPHVPMPLFPLALALLVIFIAAAVFLFYLIRKKTEGLSFPIR